MSIRLTVFLLCLIVAFAWGFAAHHCADGQGLPWWDTFIVALFAGCAAVALISAFFAGAAEHPPARKDDADISILADDSCEVLMVYQDGRMIEVIF